MIYTKTGKIMTLDGKLRSGCCHPAVWRINKDGELQGTYEIVAEGSARGGITIACNSERVAIIFGYGSPPDYYCRCLTRCFNLLWGTEDAQGSWPSVAMDADNNVYLAIMYTHNIRKFLPNGIEDWTYPTGGKNVGCITVDAAGDIVCGLESWILKLNSAGVKQWDYNFPGSIVSADIVTDGANNIYFIRQAGIQKLNAAGESQWSIGFDPLGWIFFYLHDIGIDNSGNILISTRSEWLYWDKWDVDTYGSIGLWPDASPFEVGEAVTYEEFRPAYVCIQAHSASENTRPGYGVDWEDYWVMLPRKNLWKLDSNGDLIWRKYVGSEVILDLTSGDDDAIYITGTRVGAVTVRKYPADGGDMIWGFDTTGVGRGCCFCDDLFVISDKV